MNNQENQFPQFNYGTSETEETHPQFAQQEVAVEEQPQFEQPMQQFAQQEVAPEPQPQFVQPAQAEMQPQFAQQEVQPEMQPQFPQQEVQPEMQPQFPQQEVQPEMQPQFPQQEAQPQFGQPMQPQFAQPMQQESQPQFGQVAPAMVKEKKAKKVKQPKVKKEKSDSGKSKKKSTIIAIVAAVLAVIILIGAGVFYYFHAILGSTPATAARVLDKIGSAEKIEGRVTKGNIIMKSGHDTQMIQIKDTTYFFNRTADKNRYAYLQASIVSDEKEDVTNKNIVAVTLRPSMKVEWSVLGQKGSYQTTGKEKESLEQFIAKKNSDSQKNLGELRAFLLNGYSPAIKVEGNKTTISMNKDDLEKIVRKIEDNVKTNQEKFKTLLAKINPETDANEIIESCKNGELTKSVKEYLLPNIESFKLEFSFTETSDKVLVGKMTFQLKPTHDEAKTTAEFDIQTETTYTL